MRFCIICGRDCPTYVGSLKERRKYFLLDLHFSYSAYIVLLTRKQPSTANIRRRLLFYIRSGSPNECRFFPAIGLDSPFQNPNRAVPRIVTILKIVATGRYNLRQKSNRVLKFVRICGILYKEIFRYTATYHTIHPQILTRYSKVKP